MATIMRVGGGAGGGEKAKTIASLAEGSLIAIRENGVMTPFYLAKKDYEPELNGSGRYLLVRKNVHSTMQWDAENVNAYSGSDIDLWMNGDYKERLSNSVREQMGGTKFHYRVGNGSATAEVLGRSVFALSLTELGLSHGSANVDGTELPTANILKVAFLNGVATSQWARTVHVLNTYTVFLSTASGQGDGDYAYGTQGVRPCFTLPSTMEIADEPNSDGSYSLLCDAVLDEVGQLGTGDTMLITENGIPTEYYIAKHGYEPELNGANRTLLRRKESHSARAWNSTNVNAYENSAIDTWLNGEFYNSLSASVKELIGATKFPYTPGNGNNTVSTLERAVFLLSLAELGLSNAQANVEGSALPIASTLRVTKLNGAASSQWPRTPKTAGGVFWITASGTLEGNTTLTTAYGIPPAFTIPSDAKVIGPDNYGRYTLEAEIDPNVNIYGIYRDITASSPAWARCDKASGKVATASVGTVAGHSDFDDCYPWSEIKRETLSTGDVLVKIPKFWYQRARSGNMEVIRIADAPTDGFNLHPAFNHAGAEQECIYVGAYKSINSPGNEWLDSKPGGPPYANIARSRFRQYAKNKGAGWSLIDISTLSAIQMLYLVEFAHNNSQQMIGRGYCDGNSASLATGTCDAVPNLTGRPAGTDGKTDIIYRGIEGLWGNILEFIDGINCNGGTYYVCNDPSKYADDTAAGYAALSYTGPVVTSYQYITKMGLDENGNPDLMLPQTASGGSETTYYCDAMISTTGWCVCVHGMSWSGGSQAGIFMVRLNATSSLSSTDFGSRLIYIPQ